MWRRVVWLKCSDVSEETSAYFFDAEVTILRKLLYYVQSFAGPKIRPAYLRRLCPQPSDFCPEEEGGTVLRNISAFLAHYKP